MLKANGGVHANGAVGVQTRNGDGSELHSWLRQDGTLNTVSGGGWMISGSASDASAAKILGLHRLDDDTLQLDNGTPGTFRDLKLRNLIASGDITTGAPSGGTAAAWKLGVKVDAVVVLDTAKYLQVDIAGVAYKVALAS